MAWRTQGSKTTHSRETQETQAYLVLWMGKQCVSSAGNTFLGEGQQRQCTQIVCEEGKGLSVIAGLTDFFSGLKYRDP